MDRKRQGQAVQRHHRALILEACGLAVAAVYVLALAAQHLPAALVAVAGLAAAVAFGLSVYVLTTAGYLAVVSTAWGLALTGWLTWTEVSGAAYTGDAALGLAVPALLLLPFTLAAYGAHLAVLAPDPAEPAEPQPDDPQAAVLAKWGRLLAGVGLDGVRATAADKTRGGTAVTLALPASGRVTLATLVMAADRVATARRLQPGSVTFQQGRHAGEAVMQIDERDVMSQVLAYPPAVRVMTVNEPGDLGLMADGRPLLVSLRDVAALISGATGAGKSNLLNVLIAWLTQCEDVIVCIIDVGKQGRLAAPWIRPWVEGRCDHPAVDWVATTRREAYDMLTAIDRLVTARSSAGATVAGSKITPTRDTPQFVVITDEMTDLVGIGKAAPPAGEPTNADMMTPADAATRKGRSEAVTMVWGAQRGTADFTGSTSLKSQCRLRFMLGAASEADARAMTDDPKVARLLAQAGHPGSVIVAYPGQTQAVLGKLYRLDPSEGDAGLIDALATAAGNTRPAPEDVAKLAMGEVYAQRWQRSDLYQRMLADYHIRTGRAPVASDRPAATGMATLTDADVATEAAAIFEAAGLMAAERDPRGRMYALLAERRQIGMGVAEIVAQLARDGLPVDRTTVYRWLRQDVEAGKVERRGGEGQGARYFLARD